MIVKIYEKLFEHFGAQGWWPVTPIGGCRGDLAYKPVYGIALKNEKQKLEIIFGAILTQNTSWKNVEKAIVELNKHNLIDVLKIKKIDNKKLASIIKSSGYHNQKAEKLKVFSDFLIKNYNGKINDFFEFKPDEENTENEYDKRGLKNKKQIKERNKKKIKIKKNTDELREELLSIKGIGPETADSIILYSAERPIFVIDAYTKRIMERIGFEEKSYDELQELFMKGLGHDAKLFNEYHALLVELGKNYCRKKPLCSICPLGRQICQFKDKNK